MSTPAREDPLHQHCTVSPLLSQAEEHRLMSSQAETCAQERGECVVTSAMKARVDAARYSRAVPLVESKATFRNVFPLLEFRELAQDIADSRRHHV